MAALLKPLGRSQYTITNTSHFIRKIKQNTIPPGYSHVSFDVVSLFTNVPLDDTIEIILRRIYDNKEIETDIERNDLKNLLLLCTKHVHFTFQNQTYIQTDGVAMGSPIGSILADISMVELENTLIPTLYDHIDDWSRYVEDTIGVVKTESINYVYNILNSFHPNIQFTYEVETNNNIPCLTHTHRIQHHLHNSLSQTHTQRHLHSLEFICTSNLEKRNIYHSHQTSPHHLLKHTLSKYRTMSYQKCFPSHQWFSPSCHYTNLQHSQKQSCIYSTTYSYNLPNIRSHKSQHTT